MRVACDNPSPQIAAELVSIAAAWATELDASPLTLEQMVKNKAVAAKSLLLSDFVTYELQLLGPLITDHNAVLALLKTVITMSYCSGQVQSWAYQALAESPAPIQTRRATAIAVIGDRQIRGGCVVHFALLKVFDASTFPALRQLVRQSSNPETFNFAAAAALARYGDQAILPDLETRRPAFLARHANTEGTLRRYIWQINIQHPPSGLLEYISSTEHLVSATLRRWALRRAGELGLPSADIRQAILTHAGRNPPTGPYGFRPGLEQLKKLGLELGVLNPQDLSDVVIRPSPWGDPTSRPTRPPAGPLVVPARRPWKPNQANYNVLAQWMGTINWQTIDPAEGMRLFKQKMCELDLLPPAECETVGAGTP